MKLLLLPCRPDRLVFFKEGGQAGRRKVVCLPGKRSARIDMRPMLPLLSKSMLVTDTQKLWS